VNLKSAARADPEKGAWIVGDFESGAT